MTRSSKPPSLIDPELAEQLIMLRPRSIEFGASLDSLTRWGIGGPAGALLSVERVNQVQAIRELTAEYDCPLVVIGETANLLFDSQGYRGVLLRMTGELAKPLRVDSDLLEVGAGCSVDVLADYAANLGLSGLEHTAGIPGTVGGLITMNGGSQRRSIGSSVENVEVVTGACEKKVIDRDEAYFAYRSSIFQRDGSIIVGATLKLAQSDSHAIRAEIAEIRSRRMKKFPSDHLNCGSTFLSDPAMYDVVGPPGHAIEAAGLKGLRRGGAAVSTLHANFINNEAGASSDDVLWLIATVQKRVRQRTGFTMKCEVRHVSPSGIVRPADEAARAIWPDGDRGIRCNDS